MATTNLIVDFFVIGTSALAWIAPILLATCGESLMASTVELGAGAIPICLVGLYVIGLVISRFADDVLEHWNKQMKRTIFGEDDRIGYHQRLNYIIVSSSSADEYLGYRRSIVRIARACAVNLVLGALSWGLTAKWLPIPCLYVIPICFLSIAGAFYLFRTWITVLKGYMLTIRDMHKILVRASLDPSERYPSAS